MTAEESLRAALAKNHVIAVVGAGLSIAATDGAEASSWKGLLRRGIDRVVDECRPGVSWSDAVDGLLALETAEAYLDVASMIKKQLGRRSYANWVSSEFERLTVTKPDGPSALLSLGVPIATTNFDTVLEDVGRIPSATWRQLDAMQRIFRNDHRAIAHMHGVWTDVASLVFDNETYAAVLHDADVQELQRALAVTHSLMFVGVGDAAEDPNMGSLIQWFASLGWATNEFYWLCLDGEVATVGRKYGVRPVPYGTRHDDLPGFLRRLAPSATVGSAITLHRRDDHIAPAAEPWVVTPAVDQLHAVLTVQDGLLLLTEDALGVAPARDLVVTDGGSHVVALDDDGFRVWTINLDGSLTPWSPRFAFPAGTITMRSANRVGAAITVVIDGGSAPGLRLERTGRIVVQPVAREAPRARGYRGLHGTTSTVTFTVSLDHRAGRAIVTVRRIDGNAVNEASFDAGIDGVTKASVAPPLRGHRAPYAVVVESAEQLVAWRCDDLVAASAGSRELAAQR